MKRREIELAKFIRRELFDAGLEVPDVINQAAAANPNSFIPEEEEERDKELESVKGNMVKPGKDQSVRLRDLLALSGTAPIIQEEVAEKEEEK